MGEAKICSIGGCEKRLVARGWCHNHYKRWQLYGDPCGRGTKRAPFGTGCINAEGYRVLNIKGKQVKEHRKVMEGVLGRPLQPDEVVHHRDGDKLNNDPSNLEVTTFSDHTTRHRAERELVTRCGHGHEWNDLNTYWRKDTGQRMCMACHREKSRLRYQRKRATAARGVPSTGRAIGDDAGATTPKNLEDTPSSHDVLDRTSRSE